MQPEKLARWSLATSLAGVAQPALGCPGLLSCAGGRGWLRAGEGEEAEHSEGLGSRKRVWPGWQGQLEPRIRSHGPGGQDEGPVDMWGLILDFAYPAALSSLAVW